MGSDQCGIDGHVRLLPAKVTVLNDPFEPTAACEPTADADVAP